MNKNLKTKLKNRIVLTKNLLWFVGLLLTFFSFNKSWAISLDKTIEDFQKITITGKVLDENAQPLPGASVVEKGTSKGVYTDFDGVFSISVSEENIVLEVSYVGYNAKEVTVEGKKNIIIKMSLDNSLKEVVVTGYSAQSKESITGSVSTVDVNKLKDMPDGNALRTLQGRVTGVQIGKSGGPGGNNIVRIRGFSNVSTSDPLYVIDGVPTQDSSIFNALNPADISSMQVLKDAASAAIYGARANNGVIIITTNSGASSSNKTNFSLSYSTGMQTARTEAFPTFLNPTQYGQWLWNRQKNSGATPTSDIYGNGATPVVPKYLSANGGVADLASAGTYDEKTNPIKKANLNGTDWLGTIFRSSMYHDLNLSVSKSSDKSNFYFSAAYYKNDGILKHTGFNRLSTRINSSFRVNDVLTIGENITVSYNERIGSPATQNEDGPVAMAMRINPIIPLYDIKGNFGGTKGKALGNAYNPYALLYRNRYNMFGGVNILGNVYANLDFSNWLEGLSAEARMNVDYSNREKTDYVSKSFERSEPQTQNSFTRESTKNNNMTFTGLLKYNKKFGNHKVTGLAGIEYIEQKYNIFDAKRFGYISDDIDFRYLSVGDASNQLNSGSGNQVGLFSLFFKGDYAFDSKYFVTAIVRQDESSRFLKENRSRMFPSLGVAWRLSEENFMQNVSTISNLKLRASIGQTGNQATSLAYPAYSTSSLNSINNNYSINGSPNSAAVGISTAQDGNPDLKWEIVTSTDIGFEVSFLDNKLSFEGGYYRKETSDMLVQVPRPGSAGLATNPWQNVGSMLNEGVEFATTYSNDALNNKLHYSASFNISHNQNTVTKLLDNDKAFVQGRQFRANTLTRISKGQPVSYLYGYVVDEANPFYKEGDDLSKQVSPQAVLGGFRYKDVNGDGKVDAEDRTNIGSVLPQFIYGLNLSLGYKQWGLTTFLEGQGGNKIFNQMRYLTDFETFKGAALNTKVLQSYKKVSNPIVPLNSTNVSATSQTLASSYFVEDGSFLRMRNIQLSYNMPKSVLKSMGFLTSLRVYFQVENVFVLTHYTGLDPEVNVPTSSNNKDENFNLGIDQGIYPNPRSFIVGLNIKM